MIINVSKCSFYTILSKYFCLTSNYSAHIAQLKLNLDLDRNEVIANFQIACFNFIFSVLILNNT